MADDQEFIEIETGHGTITWKRITKPPPPRLPQVIRELSNEELDELRENVTASLEFVQSYLTHDDLTNDMLENLDLAFARWLYSDDLEKEPEERVIRMVGAAYGQYCVDRLNVRWAIIRDDDGTDMGLIREAPVAWCFPFSSIQYRVEDRKADFICALYESFAHNIKNALD